MMRERIEDPEIARADPRARHPAGMGGRLDLRGSARPHPGDRRRRRGGASSTATTTSGASGATARSSTRCSTSRRSLPKLREQVDRDLREAEHLPRAGARLRRPAARPRLLPDRLRGLRRGERDLRAGDDAEAPRHRQRRDGSSSTTRPRAASGGSRSIGDRTIVRAGEEASPARGAAATSCSPIATAGSGATSAPTTSTSTSRRRHRGGPQRQGLPHLERDGAGGRRPGGLSAGARHERRREAATGRSATRSSRSPTTSATHPPSAAPPTSTRASSTASTAASPSVACSSGCRRTPRTGRRFRGRSRRPFSTSSIGVNPPPSSGLGRARCRADGMHGNLSYVNSRRAQQPWLCRCPRRVVASYPPPDTN